jgi:MFS family permease
MLKKFLPLLIGAAIGPVGGFGIVTLIPTMAEQWAVPFPTAALAISFYMIPFIIIQVFSGSIAQLFGPYRAIIFGFATYGIGAIACALSPSLVLLLYSRVLQGVGAAFLTPIIMALIGELVPDRHVGKAIGMLGVAYTVGVTLGPLIAGLMEVRYGWPSFFYLLAGLCLASSLYYGFTGEKKSVELKEQTSLMAIIPVFKNALGQPGVMRRSLAAFFLFIAYIGVMTFTADHLKNELGLASDRIGVLLSVTGFSGIIVSPIAGYLGDHLGRVKIFLFGSGVALLSVGSMVAIPFDYLIYTALFLCLGIGAATCWTSLNAMAVRISESWRQPVTSIYNAIKFSGYALSPVLLAPLYGPFRLRAVLGACIVSIAISALLAGASEPGK